MIDMKTVLSIPLRLAIVSALFTSAPLRAQETEPKVINLSVNGGTLQLLAETLRKDANARIILADDVKNLPIPDITMNNVTPTGVMQAVGRILEEKIGVKLAETDSGVVVFTVKSARQERQTAAAGSEQNLPRFQGKRRRQAGCPGSRRASQEYQRGRGARLRNQRKIERRAEPGPADH